MKQCSSFPRWSATISSASKLSPSACWIPVAADGGRRGSLTRAQRRSSATPDGSPPWGNPEPMGRQFQRAK
eukprot:14452334-Alexandrium_andersonii.AAC.1